MKKSDLPLADRLTLKTRKGYIFPDRSEIIRFEAGHNCVLAFIAGADQLVKIHATLEKIELKYPFREFYRSHKSHIVNLLHVTEFDKKNRIIFTPSGSAVLAENKVEEFKVKMGINGENRNG